MLYGYRKLDCFINKRVLNKILFIIKQSSLVPFDNRIGRPFCLWLLNHDLIFGIFVEFSNGPLNWAVLCIKESKIRV
jgi:hypothetical protein